MTQITSQRMIAERIIKDTTEQLKSETLSTDERIALEAKLSGAEALKGLYKLMNNSLSGKTYQSDEYYHESKLVTIHKQYNTVTNGKVVLNRTIISDDLV